MSATRRSYVSRLVSIAGFFVVSLPIAVQSQAAAETISGALTRAYGGNPDLNQQRAGVRAVDEGIPRATSGWRPRVTASAEAGYNYLDSSSRSADTRQRVGALPRSFGLTVEQNIFNGNFTLNSVRQAQSNVLGAREDMRNTELTVLLEGAAAYMNVLRDTAVLDLRRNNIIVLEEQLRQTRDRFTVGEVTRTDVAQAESSLARARSDYFRAQADLQNSVADYRRVIGVEPTRLDPARTIESLLPGNLTSAVDLALSEHPVIQGAMHAVDAAALEVKKIEAELYPTLGLTANVSHQNEVQGFPGQRLFNGSIFANVRVPIYEGGEVYASIRQAKERLGQARLQADLQRDFVRRDVVSRWGELETARAAIQSARAAVKAQEIALEGVREEAKVGQRTTFDVLQQQQILLNNRVDLVSFQRDRVVASYAVYAAIGRLSAANLNLNVARYDPTIHFDQVKDKWIGLRTPDGR